jgi:hypothetical protein
MSEISASKDLENCIQLLSVKSVKHAEELGRISKNLKPNWEENIHEETLNIICINKGREALVNVLSSIGAMRREEIDLISHKNKYQISSLFMVDCCKYLTSNSNLCERLHFVTGTITDDGTKVLSRMEKVKLESQSPVYVQADRGDSHKKIVNISEEFGHLLLGMFHSHTSNGASSTAPSSIDIQNLKRKDKIGISCIGGIFSFDGYVRFFSLKPFEIKIYGKGVKEIQRRDSEAIFRIERGKIRHESKSSLD